MAVTSIHTPEIDESKYSLPIENGGTSARSPEQAAANLGLVSVDQVDQQDGIALLSNTANVQRKNYPLSLSDTSLPVFFGDHVFFLDASLVIQIVNYDSTIAYVFDTTQMPNANYATDGDKITLSSFNGIVGQQILSVNGREFVFTIAPHLPEQPILANLNYQSLGDHQGIVDNVPFEGQVFTSSLFTDSSGTLTHAYTTWEISTSLTFDTLMFNSSNPADSLSWTVNNFTPATTYFLRFAHVADTGNASPWSPTYEFTTAEYHAILKPSIVSPANDAVSVTPLPVISSSAFAPVGYLPNHIASDWQLASDPAFTNILQSSINSGTNKTSWAPADLGYLAIYYARVRYRADQAGSNGSAYSDWSDAIKFTTMADNRSIQKPVAMMLNDVHTDISKTNPSFTGNAFTPLNYTDTHAGSQWQIASDNAFSTIVNDSGWSTDLTSYNPTVSLNEGASYYGRVRYKGNVKTSDWSDSVIFLTAIYLQIYAIGAGAGGGGSSTNGGWSNSTGAAGGGGGGGGVSIAQRPILLNTTYSVTVGAGGGGGGTGGAGAAGGDTFVVIPTTAEIRANGGHPGTGGSQNSWATPGGAGGAGTTRAGGQGGQGGSMRADTGGASYYAAGTAGGGLNPGPGGLSDLAYGYGPYGGGGGGSPSYAVPGIAYQGGQGRNPNSYSVDGAIGSGGGGGAYISGAGGAGGRGAVVIEYADTGPMLDAPNAVYDHVNGKHRYTWSTPGTYTFTVAAGVTTATETVTPPTLTVAGVPALSVTLNSSAFITDYPAGSHVATDWQLATDATFTNIVRSSVNDTTNKLSYPIGGLGYSTTYYARCRYRSKFDISAWSPVVGFTTMADNRWIQAPSLALTYPYGPDRPVPTASSFVPVNFSGPHESSDWQISQDPNFTPVSLTYQIVADPARLYTIEQPGNLGFAYPSVGSYYYARVRFRSQGIVSGWSASLEYYIPDPYAGGI